MNDQEKVSYLKALLYIATIDENLDDDEKQYLMNIACNYGLTSEELNNLVNTVFERKETLEEILAGIHELKSKLTLIYELIAFCYMDGKYTEKEKAGIMNFAQIMGVAEGKITELEELFCESVILQGKIGVALEA